jgi:RNA polymerase sigma-70 factor (ECF subfamily)
MKESNDIDLINRVINGDNEAYKEIIEKYQNSVYSLIYRLCGNKTEAEDITQETFIKAYEHLKDFKIGYKFSNWLFTIGINITKNILKRKKFAFLSIDKLISVNDEESDNVPVQIASNDNPEQDLIKNENEKLLNDMLQTLPEKYREVFYLRFIEEYPYNEISQICNLPQGTVKTYLFRARKILYKKFGKII